MATVMKSAAVVMAFAGVVIAQSSTVISIFLPDTDQQTLVGSLIASDASKTTVVFGCPSDVDSSDCGFGSGLVTATFGPSTLAVTESIDSLIATLDCVVSGTTAASCVQTYTGPAGFFEEATATDDSLTASDSSFDTHITTSVTTTILAQSEMAFVPITLTAFANAQGTGSAGTGAGAGLSTVTSTSQGAQTTASSTSSATSSGGNASGNTASIAGAQLKWIAGTAALMGLAVMLL